MSEAQKRMSKTVLDHTPSGAEGHVTCWCGNRFASFADHSDHVAAAIDKALGGLTREEMEGMRVGDDPRLEPYRESRWVSGWTEAPHD